MTSSRSLRRALRLLTVASTLLAPTLAGCQSLSLPGKLPWSKETVKESEFPTPVRMAVLWAEDVMTSQGQTPARGFGARIYFYNEKNQTIPVEGQMVVYGYDDSKGDVSSRTPDRKFVFTADQFSQHFSKSDLGASYSIWVPWDAIGGPQKEVSLIPVFTSTAGKVVVGPQGVNILAGPDGGKSKPDKLGRSDRRTLPSPDVRTVAHWERDAQAGEDAPHDAAENSPDIAGRRKPSSIRTSTIFVPNSLGRRMGAEAPEGSLGGDAATTEPRPIPGSAAASSMFPQGAPANGPSPGHPNLYAPPHGASQIGAAPYGAYPAGAAPAFPASATQLPPNYSATPGVPHGPIDPRFAALGNFSPGGTVPGNAGPTMGTPNYSAPMMNAPGMATPGMMGPGMGPTSGPAPGGVPLPANPTPGRLPAGFPPAQFPAPTAPFAQ